MPKFVAFLRFEDDSEEDSGAESGVGAEAESFSGVGSAGGSEEDSRGDFSVGGSSVVVVSSSCF